jgi:hypothetical protein
MRSLAIAVVMVVASLGAYATPDACPDCVPAQYWQIDPDYWKAAQPDLNSFPERQLETPLPGADLGVAFSGGGTRSATATIGELRGLAHNGWLRRVKYITAVSGGSWAAVPFTYYPGDTLDDLLGAYQSPGTPVPDAMRDTPNGLLALQVTQSGLAASGIAEAPALLPDSIRSVNIAQMRDVLITVRDGIRKIRHRDLPDSTRQNKTYAHMLGQIFINPPVPGAVRKPYSWTRASAIEVSRVSGLPQMDFQQVPEGRPFLIAGGTLVWMRPGFVYPRLIPVEFTPLYTGIRQRFDTLGGTYVMPWAYDREHAVVSGDKSVNRVLVDRSDVRMFTLADVIATSGAAPQLSLLIGDGVPATLRDRLRAAAGAFPAFHPLAVRDDKAVPSAGEMAHGDGGFTDNFGLMPLLARQVHHIIAFVNSNKTYTDNDQLQSYFFPLAVQTGNGDKTMNAVFPKDKYRVLLDGLDRAVKDGGPAVFCDTVTVAKNELYNIAEYDGLEICWVYNHASGSWHDGLPDGIKTWLKKPADGGLKGLQHFPYYATFEENKPHVIKLTALQVNLLADLACWSITNDASTKRIGDYFGTAVLPPR